MSRGRNRRATRALAGILLTLFVLAGVIYFVRPSRSSAEQSSSAAPPSQTDAPAVVAPSDPPRASAAESSAAVRLQREPAPTPPRSSAVGAPTIQLAQATQLPAPVVLAVPATQPAASAPPAGVTAKPSAAAPATTQPAEPAADSPVATRAALNRQLIAGGLSASREQELKGQIEQLNDSLLFSRRVVPEDPYTYSYTVKSGDVMARIAQQNGVTWELLCRLNGMTDPRKLRAGQTLKVARGPIHAIVDKSDFTMDLYFGSPGGPDAMYVASYPVGLGEQDSTPTGTWQVEQGKKLINPTYFSPRGEGVVQADDPKNPLGERWIGLIGIDGAAAGKQSYGIHGTIEPDSIGQMASMGCIRLHNEDVARVFEMLVDGKSTVLVRE